MAWQRATEVRAVATCGLPVRSRTEERLRVPFAFARRVVDAGRSVRAVGPREGWVRLGSFEPPVSISTRHHGVTRWRPDSPPLCEKKPPIFRTLGRSIGAARCRDGLRLGRRSSDERVRQAEPRASESAPWHVASTTVQCTGVESTVMPPTAAMRSGMCVIGRQELFEAGRSRGRLSRIVNRSARAPSQTRTVTCAGPGCLGSVVDCGEAMEVDGSLDLGSLSANVDRQYRTPVADTECRSPTPLPTSARACLRRRARHSARPRYAASDRRRARPRPTFRHGPSAMTRERLN
jgi:hypothetical protein